MEMILFLPSTSTGDIHLAVDLDGCHYRAGWAQSEGQREAEGNALRPQLYRHDDNITTRDYLHVVCLFHFAL